MPPLVTNQPSHWRSWAAERVRDATVAMSPGTELENKGGGVFRFKFFAVVGLGLVVGLRNGGSRILCRTTVGYVLSKRGEKLCH